MRSGLVMPREIIRASALAPSSQVIAPTFLTKIEACAAHFAYNYLAEITTVSATLPAPLLAGEALEITARFTKTAEFVGMERSALHRKLKALGID